MKDEHRKNGAKNHLFALLRKTQAALEESERKVALLEQKIAENENNAYSPTNFSIAAVEDDEEILAQILSSELVRKKIIEDYLRSLSLNKNLAVLGRRVGSTPLTPPKRPKSLAEAKKLAEILIKG
jgi:hypothetical protein